MSATHWRKLPPQGCIGSPLRMLTTPFSSVVKRKLSAGALGRALPTQSRQALLLGLAYNL